ncbi:TPA: ribosome silencing factor [Candidatus Latescibacteria bacterium]|nr:ribosome silencing factor [Gemmatimonadota bacterium]HAA74443.1 ribosome silencing factor [Candidatus Latescibacterota bacterium]
MDTFTQPLLEMKAEEVVLLDLRGGIAEFADYFIICTGNSDIQVRAIADALVERGKADGQRPLNIEGYDQRTWILIDFVDVVVHIMQPDERKFYGLERLWGDAPVHEIEDTPVAEAP